MATVTKTTKVKKVAEKPKGLVVAVVGVDGTQTGSMSLPKELFGVPVNKQLLAQAVRVYMANQRAGSAHTKTRGDVEGSTRKIYRQKGTGKARHGGIRAPIFVGGGVAFGPKAHSFALDMPKAMRRSALASALSSRLADHAVVVVSGLEKLEPKTKPMADALSHVNSGKKTLLVTGADASMIMRTARNIAGVTVTPSRLLTVYPILSCGTLVFTQDAIVELKKTFIA